MGLLRLVKNAGEDVSRAVSVPARCGWYPRPPPPWWSMSIEDELRALGDDLADEQVRRQYPAITRAHARVMQDAQALQARRDLSDSTIGKLLDQLRRCGMPGRRRSAHPR